MTSGMATCPPDMYRILAALLMTWSRARIPKLKVIHSTMGRRPTMAAPTQTPVNPSSVMGVSMTLPGPYLSSSPLLTL